MRNTIHVTAFSLGCLPSSISRRKMPFKSHLQTSYSSYTGILLTMAFLPGIGWRSRLVPSSIPTTLLGQDPHHRVLTLHINAMSGDYHYLVLYKPNIIVFPKRRFSESESDQTHHPAFLARAAVLTTYAVFPDTPPTTMFEFWCICHDRTCFPNTILTLYPGAADDIEEKMEMNMYGFAKEKRNLTPSYICSLRGEGEDKDPLPMAACEAYCILEES